MKDKSALMQKTAIRFAKVGPSIYHSHHDMIRFWERAVKRANLPMRLTQGFNPRPRMVFPHALGVGIASRHEEVELELHAAVPLDDLLRRITDACGDTLDILEAVNLPPVKKSRQMTASFYRICGWPASANETLGGIGDLILGRGEIVVERGAPGDKRRVDIRPHIKSVAYDAAAGCIELELSHSQSGSARPDEIAKLAAAEAGVDWRDLTMEKTGMCLS